MARISARGRFFIVAGIENDTGRDFIANLLKVIDDLIAKGGRYLAIDLRDFPVIHSLILGALGEAYCRVEAVRGSLYAIIDDKNCIETLNLSGLNLLVHTVRAPEDLPIEPAAHELTGIKQADDGPSFHGHGETGRAIAENDEGTRALILVVDDSRVMRELIQKKVHDIGYDAIAAESGMDALEKVRAFNPDVVLMDVNMPGMDGYEACSRIKAGMRDRHIPVIFVTSLKEPAEKLNALKAGGDDFVNKPVQNEDLLFRIGTHLKLKRLAVDLTYMNENLERMVFEKTKTLMETERQLYQAEKMSTIGTMLSGIAHELKNPIFIIGTWADMLKKGGSLSAEQDRALGYISEQAARSASIVENLLKLARKKVEEVKSLDVNEIVENFRHNLEYLIVNKSIEFTTDLNATRTITGSVSEFEQILVNLVSNAVDAIEKNGVVSIRTFDSRDGCVMEVEDNGCGMSDGVRARIFDPFYTTKETGKGTGLGLSIIYKIVQSHRGAVSVRSTPGKGTVFSVYFPSSARP